MSGDQNPPQTPPAPADQSCKHCAQVFPGLHTHTHTHTRFTLRPRGIPNQVHVRAHANGQAQRAKHAHRAHASIVHPQSSPPQSQRERACTSAGARGRERDQKTGSLGSEIWRHLMLMSTKSRHPKSCGLPGYMYECVCVCACVCVYPRARARAHTHLQYTYTYKHTSYAAAYCCPTHHIMHHTCISQSPTAHAYLYTLFHTVVLARTLGVESEGHTPGAIIALGPLQSNA